MRRSLRVGVMGAGAIGCWVGGKLLAAGAAEVVFVGRVRVRDELAAHGLTVEEPGRDAVTLNADRVRVETETAALAGCDAVLVCVKSAQTREAGRALAEVLPRDAAVVTLQNGLRNADVLRESLPSVVSGFVGFNVRSKGGGVFRRTNTGAITIEASEAARELVHTLRASGLSIDQPADIRAAQWTKLLINLNNAVSALSGAPTREIIASGGYRRIVAALVEEGYAVARAAGVRPAPLRGVPVWLMPPALRLPTPLVKLLLRAQFDVDPEARSSMWEDLTRARPTEVDVLNGEVVRVAEEVGVDAPLNRRVVELVHEAERAASGPPGLSAEAIEARLRRA